MIADTFYKAGLIEKYGSGLIRIRKEIQAYPTMKFSFEEVPNGFSTVVEYTHQKISIVTENVTDKPTDKSTDKPTDKPTDKLSINQVKILQIISANPYITSKEIAVALEIRPDSIRVNISKLKDKGLLERIGPAKGGYWVVL